MSQPKIDPAILVAEYERGDSSTEIAARHGVHKTNVCKHLRAAGVKIRGRHDGLKRRRQAKRLLAKGRTQAEVAEIMGITQQAVSWLAAQPDG
jgi:DNA-binding CsgD family transcriptional regulator